MLKPQKLIILRPLKINIKTHKQQKQIWNDKK